MHSQTVLDLARYFVHLGEKSKRPLTNKKLQKLLYYAQAWSLVLRKKPIFDEPIEAWPHGPVVSKVYHHYKKFGFETIQEKNEFESSLPKDIKKHLDEV
ncbi:MAG: DUF4065 domain-containing protein [Chlamydiae bacterium]|nr:DUF4065 domain-containing protein [Chlamydiota bacterium]